MASNTYSVNEILGKDLFAKVTIAIRQTPSDTAPALRTVKAGDRVGTVFSYVERTGVIWWQLKDSGFVKHGSGRFDLKALKQQGVMSNEEIKKAEEEAKKSKIEKGIDTIIAGATKLGILLLVGTVVYYSSTQDKN